MRELVARKELACALPRTNAAGGGAHTIWRGSTGSMAPCVSLKPISMLPAKVAFVAFAQRRGEAKGHGSAGRRFPARSFTRPLSPVQGSLAHA